MSTRAATDVPEAMRHDSDGAEGGGGRREGGAGHYRSMEPPECDQLTIALDISGARQSAYFSACDRVAQRTASFFANSETDLREVARLRPEVKKAI